MPWELVYSSRCASSSKESSLTNSHANSLFLLLELIPSSMVLSSEAFSPSGPAGIHTQSHSKPEYFFTRQG